VGEMMATAGRITAGDFESWFTEWDKVGRRILSRADASLGAGHLESAREAYLSASTYFRTAEFYLHGDPGDPRILSESRASQKAYAEGAKLSGPTWEPVQILYDGFDSSLEELFYFGGAPAVRRGYNCLTFDGLGQGATENQSFTNGIMPAEKEKAEIGQKFLTGLSRKKSGCACRVPLHQNNFSLIRTAHKSPSAFDLTVFQKLLCAGQGLIVLR
jgi:hypothetical protein